MSDSGDRRDNRGQERDEDAAKRDLGANLRDLASARIDDAGDVRDEAGAARDDAGDRRDTAGARRDVAGDLRDDMADERDRLDEDADSHPPLDLNDAVDRLRTARRDAAADRTISADDRRAGAGDRSDAQLDRSAALDDRHAGARRRQRGESDREIASEDRSEAEIDRTSAHADRGASALERDDASIDSLTGVSIRGAGFLALDREIARVRRKDEPLVAAFVDVDHLKAVNDTRGHAAGDCLLRNVADALRSNLRAYDLVFRYGGDEFVCAISAAVDEVTKRIELVNATLSQHLNCGSVTAGLAELRPTETSTELVARADLDLYEQRQVARASAPPRASSQGTLMCSQGHAGSPGS